MVSVRNLLWMGGFVSWYVCLRRDMPDVTGWTSSGSLCRGKEERWKTKPFRCCLSMSYLVVCDPFIFVLLVARCGVLTC